MPYSRTQGKQHNLLHGYSTNEEPSSPKFLDCYDTNDNMNGVSVIWKNLSVTADVTESHMFKPSTHTYKRIINNVTGAIQPGNMVAILGASGSGKTTLMSVLSNRSPAGLIIEGDIKIDGRQIGKFMKHTSGYVFQDDLFPPSLTVTEYLNFAAQLKLDRRVTSKARKQLIIGILYDLGIQNCSNRYISVSSVKKYKSDLSGGERRRISIAIELLTNPSLLFCDEPTTGLDSYSALKLVTVLRDIASLKNKTIICSVHQPSEQVFKLFQQIILLSNGRIAFMGSYKDAISYFKSIGYNYVEDQNPAEFLVKSLAISPCDETEGSCRTNNICDQFEKSEYYSHISSFIKNETEKLKKNPFLPVKNIQSPLWINKLCVMTHRTFLNIVRDPSIQLIDIIYRVFLLGLMTGLCVRGSVRRTQHGIQALEGVLFLLITENFFPPLYHIMNHFPAQMPVFYREQSNGINTTLLFLLSNILSLIPGFMVNSLSYTLVVYWLAELNQTIFPVLITCLVTVLEFVCSSSFGMFMSVMCGSSTLASIVVIPVDNICMILSGMYISLKSLPPFVPWLQYISWFKYGCEALFIVQLTDIDHFACLPNPDLPCLRTGTEVLARHGYDESHLQMNIIYLLIFYVVFNMLTFISLQIRTHFRSV